MRRTVVSALIARSIGLVRPLFYLVWLAGVLIPISNNGPHLRHPFVSECLGVIHPRTLPMLAGCSSISLPALPWFHSSISSPCLLNRRLGSGSLWLFAAIVPSAASQDDVLFNISIARADVSTSAYSAIVISLLNAIAVVILCGMRLLAYLILFAIACVAYASYATMKLRRRVRRTSNRLMPPCSSGSAIICCGRWC
jgi:hypothetical protein